MTLITSLLFSSILLSIAFRPDLKVHRNILHLCSAFSASGELQLKHTLSSTFWSSPPVLLVFSTSKQKQKSYSSSNASMDAGWNNSCHRVWMLLRLYLHCPPFWCIPTPLGFLFIFSFVDNVFVACQQELHADAILFYQFFVSIHLSKAGTVSKRMDISSHFFDVLVGASVSF